MKDDWSWNFHSISGAEPELNSKLRSSGSFIERLGRLKEARRIESEQQAVL
jgi:hypothetical protein